MIDYVKTNSLFIIYWVGLGVLSSVGLGTGLHTFLLYLGPHIASVTLAAYECSSLDFPEPPYPNEYGKHSMNKTLDYLIIFFHFITELYARMTLIRHLFQQYGILWQKFDLKHFYGEPVRH